MPTLAKLEKAMIKAGDKHYKATIRLEIAEKRLRAATRAYYDAEEAQKQKGQKRGKA